MGIRRSPLFKIISALMFLALLWSPAGAEIYTWRDSDGVLNATNSRDNVPPHVKVEVLPDLPRIPESTVAKAVPEPPKTEVAPAPAPMPVTATEENRVTEGRFVVALAGELGLGRDLTVEEAADLLTQIRVIPPLGRWKFEEPMTPELAARLRALTVSAAQRGVLSIQPEEALLAFDATAALLNVPIAAGGDVLSDRAASTLVDSPPLILIQPPPVQIVSSYVWVPVEPGFVWNGVRCTGFFVLNQRHGGRFVFLDRDRIAHRFTDRVHGRFWINGPFAEPFVDPFPPVFIVPPPRFDHRIHVPPAVFPRPERHLRGGASRSFSNNGPTLHSLTPLAPRQGLSIFPMAPPAPNSPPAPAPSRPPRPATHPRRALRG
ncbi:MAG: DUF4124 domain-containing protein [Candidatus Manganitrophaceae bacterium]|nr:MAG: DUF4124 domain-containing protein [Candidatus Manganitrophaceae bacterium]